MTHDIPHDADAERALLGSMVLEPRALLQGIDLIEAGDLYDYKNRFVFDALKDEAINGSGVLDIVTLAAHLRFKGQLEKIGGPSGLSELLDVERMPAPALIKKHAAIIKEHSRCRQLLNATQRATAALAGGKDAQGVQSALLEALTSIERPRAATGGDLATLTRTAAQKVLTIQAGDVKSLGVQTGISTLDGILQGLKPSAMYIFAARPRIGKSTLVDQIAATVAEADKRPVFELITEMSPQQRAARRLAVVTGVPLTRLNIGRLTQDERKWVTAVAEGERRAPANVYVESAAGLTAGEVRLAVKRLAAKHGGPSLIVVDYLQQLRAANPRASMVERTGEKSRVLCDMAVELDCPVIVCSQLSRACETERREPRLSDLRESGDLEQDAFAVGFLHRPDMEDQTKVVFILAKHRDGPEGMVPLRFRPEVFRFEGYRD